ncbi:NUDIX hydrolase [Niabella ginsengisoli]|uniref:NUDIX domain-containing protein n=1 Tax=Niabella ginsengisoli TaxID=522298 RepID=A0ABS9SQ96_9BACT|nr:NUDIX domain-containing protein [Niabella ginsengisoli]MCH5600515.1 NUDIX domain-containing protein [Niabella ginsengisoli]
MYIEHSVMTMTNHLNLKSAAAEKSSHPEYFNIAVSVDCVIFGYEGKELKVLLIKSDFEEFSDLYSLLGDLVKPDEDLDAASYRVLRERTGLDDVFLQQVHTFGAVDRHPSGRVVSTAYYSLVNINSHKLNINTNDLHWHSIKSIKKLAFDHKKILDTCVQMLQEQIMDHPVVHNLLPEKFSLRALQELYEAILGTSLDRRNFRKKIALKNWLSELDELEEGVTHRPGKLHKFKTKPLNLLKGISK